MVVPGTALSGSLSPSPISRVLLGRTQEVEIWIAPAGSRMVEGGGFVIPAHGLAEQVMLVGGVLVGTARASITAPVAGYPVVMTKCKTPQKSRLRLANWL